MTVLAVGKDGKVQLQLAMPTVEGLAKLYERLTGRSLSPEGIEELRRIVEEQTRKSEQSARPLDRRAAGPSEDGMKGIGKLLSCIILAGRDRDSLGQRTAMAIDRAICYICREPGADTRDHVIPACFFPSPRPANLLTLAAHYSCHNRLDEEYLRNLMASFGRDSSASAALLWDTQGDVRASFARNTPLRTSVLAGMVPRTEVFSPGGIYLGDAPAIRFDRRRVYPSLEKIVRGLYRHHTGRLLLRDAKFSWGLNEILYGGREQMFGYATPGLAYGDIFESRYIVERENGLEIVAWWLRFYQWTVFRCFVAPHSVADEARPSQTKRLADERLPPHGSSSVLPLGGAPWPSREPCA